MQLLLEQWKKYINEVQLDDVRARLKGKKFLKTAKWILSQPNYDLTDATVELFLKSELEPVFEMPIKNLKSPQLQATLLNWLITRFMQREILIEDIAAPEKAPLYFRYFEEYQNRLEKKDIWQYKNLAQLYMVLVPFINAPKINNDQAEQIPGAEELLNDSVYQILTPKTHEASRKLGVGTQWCTAFESSQWYDDYTNRGRIFIIFDKIHNTKYQFHFESSQFMDKNDATIMLDEYDFYFHLPSNTPSLVFLDILQHMQDVNISEAQTYIKEKNLQISNTTDSLILQYSTENIHGKQLLNTIQHDKHKEKTLTYQQIGPNSSYKYVSFVNGKLHSDSGPAVIPFRRDVKFLYALNNITIYQDYFENDEAHAEVALTWSTPLPPSPRPSHEPAKIKKICNQQLEEFITTKQIPVKWQDTLHTHAWQKAYPMLKIRWEAENGVPNYEDASFFCSVEIDNSHKSDEILLAYKIADELVTYKNWRKYDKRLLNGLTTLNQKNNQLVAYFRGLPNIPEGDYVAVFYCCELLKRLQIAIEK